MHDAGAPALAVSGNIRQAVPFFGVADMAASLRFYGDGLGFEVRTRWEPEGALRWCWMERGGQR